MSKQKKTWIDKAKEELPDEFYPLLDQWAPILMNMAYSEFMTWSGLVLGGHTRKQKNYLYRRMNPSERALAMGVERTEINRLNKKMQDRRKANREFQKTLGETVLALLSEWITMHVGVPLSVQ